MPRTSRAVAQRLATQQKSRRRRPPKQSPQTPASVERILDEVAPLSEGTASTAGLVADSGQTVGMAGRGTALGARRGFGATARSVPTRRRYADYAAEYSYVWADLRRIAVVAGLLLLLLMVIWFFIG